MTQSLARHCQSIRMGRVRVIFIGIGVVVATLVAAMVVTTCSNPVLDSVLSRNHSKLKKVLQSGANPDKLRCIELYPGRQRWTPLMWSIDQDNFRAAELLLTYGADPNHEAEFGPTPLMVCILRHQLSAGMQVEKFIKILHEHGASIDHKDSYGQTALHYAAQAGMHSVVAVLLKSGANPNVVDNYGSTPLHFVVQQESGLDIAVLLVSAGADVDIKDASGRSLRSRLLDGEGCACPELVELLGDQLDK